MTTTIYNFDILIVYIYQYIYSICVIYLKVEFDENQLSIETT